MLYKLDNHIYNKGTLKNKKSKSQTKKQYIYKIWFDFVILEDGNKITTQKVDIDCTEVYDERGYIHKEKVLKIFKPLLKEQVSKV